MIIPQVFGNVLRQVEENESYVLYGVLVPWFFLQGNRFIRNRLAAV